MFTGLVPSPFLLKKGRSGEKNRRPLQRNQRQTKNYYGLSVTRGKFFKTTRFSSRDIKAKRPSEIARAERLRIIYTFDSIHTAIIYYIQDFRVYEETRDQSMTGTFPASPIF